MKTLRRPRGEESRNALLAAWQRWQQSNGIPVEEAGEPSPMFARAWDRAIEWYRSQPKHAA